jgi:uncharacterized protein
MTARPLPPPPPASPCVLVCRMDAAGRWCLGCARTRDEISRWWAMPDDEKRAVLAALPSRRGGQRPAADGCRP